MAKRRAYTLIELLVVIVILTILVAISLPVAKSVLENDRVRESARQLNAYFAMAKTRTIQTGRPHGILFVLETPLAFDPAPTNPGPYTTANPQRFVRQATKCFLAEVPPPYSGSTLGARGRIMPSTAHIGTYEFNPIWYNTGTSMYEPDLVELAYLYTLINQGERFVVRFNHKGPWYVCQRGKALDPNGYTDPTLLYFLGNHTLSGSAQAAGAFTVPAMPPQTAVPFPPGIAFNNIPGDYYQILRSPKPVGNPLELTAGTCIDMTMSGTGVAGNEFILAQNSLAIMFTTTGGVTAIYQDTFTVDPTGTVHFLVGRTNFMSNPITDNDGDTIPNLFDQNDSNLSLGTSLWVSVGRANGTVSTAENIPPALTNVAIPNLTYLFTTPDGGSQSVTLDTTNPTDVATYLGHCRQLGTGRKQIGGQ